MEYHGESPASCKTYVHDISQNAEGPHSQVYILPFLVTTSSMLIRSQSRPLAPRPTYSKPANSKKRRLSGLEIPAVRPAPGLNITVGNSIMQCQSNYSYPGHSALPSPASTQSAPASVVSFDTVSPQIMFSQEVMWSPQVIPDHLALPKIKVDDTPMARAITSYLDLARSMLSQGMTLQQVFGPDRPNVDLLFRLRKPTDSHSVCNFAAELCSGVKGIELPARLGMTFMFVYLLRVSI